MFVRTGDCPTASAMLDVRTLWPGVSRDASWADSVDLNLAAPPSVAAATRECLGFS